MMALPFFIFVASFVAIFAGNARIALGAGVVGNALIIALFYPHV